MTRKKINGIFERIRTSSHWLQRRRWTMDAGQRAITIKDLMCNFLQILELKPIGLTTMTLYVIH